MPRLKTAGRLARERLAAPDCSETERIALLKIIAGDERRKTNERIAKLNPSARRYSKKPSPVVPAAPAKADKRTAAKETSIHAKGQTLGEFLVTLPEPVVEIAPVEAAPAPVEQPAPQAEPVAAPVPSSGHVIY